MDVTVEQEANVSTQNPDGDFVSPSRQALLQEEVDLSGHRKGVVILEPGGYNLRFGFAEAADRKPASMLHAIAYRRDQSLTDAEISSSSTHVSAAHAHASSNSMQLSEQHSTSSTTDTEPDKPPSSEADLFEVTLAQLEEDYDHLSKDLERANKNSPVRFLSAENCQETLNKEQNQNPTEWANILGMPERIIGDLALYLDDDDGYDIFFPLRNGRFNYISPHMTHIPEQDRYSISTTMILDSLEHIWSYAIHERLEISKSDIARFDVALVIPDTFIPSEVQHMIDILLNKIGFGHIILQKSSVCAALAAGKNGTCVVNLGFTHTTVCCVDELEIINGSSYTTLVGGLDVSKFLKAQLTRNTSKQFFKYVDCNLDRSIQDLIIFEEMKESTCHLNPSLIQPKPYEFMVQHRHQDSSLLYRLDVGMAQFFSPMVLCFPELDTERTEKYARYDETSPSIGHKLFALHRPEDHWASIFHRPLQADKDTILKLSSKTPTLPAKTQSMDTTPDLTTTVAEAAAVQGPSEEDLVKLLGESRLRMTIPERAIKHEAVNLDLAHLIVASIVSASSNSFFQRRMYSQILIVGGSAHFDNLPQMIENELIGLIAPEAAPSISVNTLPQGVDPSNAAWTGAALLISQTPRDFWLDRVAWRNFGLLALREKLMFSWDNPQNRKLK
jgi:actin-related protein